MMYTMKVEENCLKSKIGLKIKFERQKRNLTQEKLAELAGLSTNCIGTIERATASPTTDSIERIARALGMEPHDLLNVKKIEL